MKSQELHVYNGGSLYISPKSAVYVNNNLIVDAAGDLSISSNATNSGSLLVSGIATGDISYQKYIPDANWHLVSAPVTTQSINAFATNAANAIRLSVSNKYGVSKYNNTKAAGERWEYYTSTAGPLAAADAGNFVTGKGYSNLRSEAGHYIFKGAMASSDVLVDITGQTGHKWSVVGNPYPSFLPLNNGANNTNNILKQNISKLGAEFAALYFWDGTAYLPFNHSADAFSLIPGQAFVVRAVDNSNLNFTFPKNLQTEQVGIKLNLLKTGGTPQIIISLHSDKVTKKTNLKYFSNTTAGLDVGYDAGTYEDATPTLAIDTHLVADSKGINFAVQCLSNDDYETDIVPMSIKASTNKDLTFSAEVINLPDGVKVFLEDKEAQIFTDITTASYKVTTKDALNGIGRFYLHTSKKSVLSAENLGVVTTVNMYKTSNTNLRVSGLQQNGSAVVKMHTILGKEVLSSNFKMQTVNDIALPKNLAAGVYVIQLIANGAIQTKKIIID
ncbi:hypothetical protein BTO16_04825 [Polaribacter glomeratus]|uniref:Secretion system C-terminal sorting domain-containing protein n=2 Tax=Polaribacter glomeratus TaxID=102 RepID=A0A2S7WWT5_9FLAO|nr:hypothetical protein BTO16_04825 [Polaribacter glomeratus]